MYFQEVYAVFCCCCYYNIIFAKCGPVVKASLSAMASQQLTSFLVMQAPSLPVLHLWCKGCLAHPASFQGKISLCDSLFVQFVVLTAFLDTLAKHYLTSVLTVVVGTAKHHMHRLTGFPGGRVLGGDPPPPKKTWPLPPPPKKIRQKQIFLKMLTALAFSTPTPNNINSPPPQHRILQETLIDLVAVNKNIFVQSLAFLQERHLLSSLLDSDSRAIQCVIVASDLWARQGILDISFWLCELLDHWIVHFGWLSEVQTYMNGCFL